MKKKLRLRLHETKKKVIRNKQKNKKTKSRVQFT